MGRWKLAAVCRLMAIVGLGLASSACATIISGTTQDLYVDSEPKGASCKIDRQGAVVGMINPTPGKVNVPRHKDNIVVSCALDGYEQSNEVLASSFSGATFGNLLLGGIVGVVIDASSGANNKYPERIVVVMTAVDLSQRWRARRLLCQPDGAAGGRSERRDQADQHQLLIDRQRTLLDRGQAGPRGPRQGGRGGRAETTCRQGRAGLLTSLSC